MKKDINFELKKTGVILDDDHRYWLGEKELFGITGMIKKLVLGDPLKFVSKAVLDNRADFGKVFHEEMELYINMGIEGTSETFKVFKEHYADKVNFVKSEYIVTDYERYASPIDAIDDEEIIWDFKTPTRKDVKYWEWQMGVYCYLYRLVNGRRPKGCRVMWINKDGKHEIVVINPVSEDKVKALFDADMNGTEYVEPEVSQDADNEESGQGRSGDADIQLLSSERLQSIYDIEQMIISLENQKKEAEQRKEELCKGLIEIFKQKGVKSFNTDKLTITYKEPSTRNGFDSARFKAEHEDMYKQYTKVSNVKESLTIKIK
jgi:hypothetical protein